MMYIDPIKAFVFTFGMCMLCLGTGFIFGRLWQMTIYQERKKNDKNNSETLPKV